MAEVRIDVPDPLVDLVAIEQRVTRRRLSWAGILGGVVSAPHVDHVTLSNATLSLGHPGLTLTSVSISPSTAAFVQAGQTQQFTAVQLDQNKNPMAAQLPMGWSSSNPAVASVNSNGLATCAGTNGTTTIQAFVQGQPNFFANAAVTTNLQALTVNHVVVTPPAVTLLHTVVAAPVPTTVTVTPAGESIQLGTQQQMTAVVKTAGGNVLSGLTITWHSTNQNVATISASGLVTPVALGTTTIYASVIDQGQTLNTYANLKGIRHGYSTNWHYRTSGVYPAQYPKVFQDLTNGIATEETAFNIYNLTTSASTPGNIQWSSAQLAICDQQIADWNASGARPLLYLLNGDVTNGEPSWYSQITTPALATTALYGIIDFAMARWGSSIWGVVLFNELMKSFGQQPNGYQTNTFITQLGQSFTTGFFALAAQRVRADAPNVQIWINCNHSESDSAGDSANWTNILAMLTGLVGNACPLNGFRFECHQNLSFGTVYSKIQARANAVTALGLKYGIGEMDNADDLLLGSGPAGQWQRDETGASIRTAILNAMMTSNALPDHVMEWQDSSQTSWLNSPPEARAGNKPGGSVYDRQQHTTDGDSFVVSGQTFYTHQVVPNTGTLGQTAANNALSVMVTPDVGTALTQGAAVTYTPGLTGGNLAQTGGITLSAAVASGSSVLPLTATTLTGTTIEGTHGRPNSRDETYRATPNYRAHLQAYGGPVGSTTLSVVASSGFSLPNLPGGMTLLSSRSGLVAPAGSESPGPWGTNTGATNLAEVADSTVPWGGPNVTQITYPVGLGGGSTPTFNWCTAPGGHGYHRIYWAFAWKMQTGFVFNSSGVNKIFYGKPTQGSTTYLAALNNGNGTFQPQFRNQSPLPVSQNFPPNVAGNTGFACTLGQWYIWEVLLTLNTVLTSPSNGLVDIWITAGGKTTHTHSYTTVLMTTVASDTWAEIDFQPYWGGSGASLTTQEFAYLGPCVIYGST